MSAIWVQFVIQNILKKKTVKIREGSPDSRSKWLGLSNKM